MVPGKILVWNPADNGFQASLAGVDAAAIIATKIASMPLGGVVDVRYMQGPQVWNSNPLANVTVPITLLLGECTITVAAGVTIAISASNVTIKGAGPGRTIFKFVNPTQDGFLLAVTNCSFSHFCIDMQNVGTGSAIHLTGMLDCDFERIETRYAGGYGWWFDAQNSGNSLARGSFRNNVTHHNTLHGWYVSATTQANEFDVIRNEHLESYANGGDGVRHLGATQTELITWQYELLRCEVNKGAGVKVIQSGGIAIITSEIEGNLGYGVDIDANSSDIWMENVGFFNNALGTVNRLGQRIFIWQKVAYPQWSGLQLIADRDSASPIFIRAHSASQTGDLLQFQAFDSSLLGNVTAKGIIGLSKFSVAGLPSGAEGQVAYATNGRKVGEGSGAGTGVPVYFSNGSWRVCSTDAAVAS